MASGVVYIGGGHSFEAFSANGSTNYFWHAQGLPSVVGEQLERCIFLAGHRQRDRSRQRPVDDKLYAFYASGSANCSGTPTTCSPLWTASMGTTTSTASPAVSAGVVYDESNDAKLFAFDADGVTNCSGTPTTCSPLWTPPWSEPPTTPPRQWPTASSTPPSALLAAAERERRHRLLRDAKDVHALWSDNVDRHRGLALCSQRTGLHRLLL